MSFDLLGVGRWVSAPRPGRRKGGFPPGGPWDEESFALACALTGATEAFELDTGRLTFREAGTWAIVGAGIGELRPVGPSEIIEAKRRVYVAWARGLAGSEARATGVAHPPERGNVLRILPGPQAELLGHLLDREFTVDRLSDRTGLRFSGTEPHGMEIPSEPATFGAIQLTPNGTPILLGPDGPTLGGYPKPAVVIRADRDLAGRLMPGDPVRLLLVAREEAEALWQKRRGKTGQTLVQIRLGVNALGFRTSNLTHRAETSDNGD